MKMGGDRVQLWIILLIIFGSFIIFGLLYDWVAKKKNMNTDFQGGVKSLNEAKNIYAEKTLEDAKGKIGNNGKW